MLMEWSLFVRFAGTAMNSRETNRCSKLLCRSTTALPSPVILWTVLGGKPKWLPVSFGWHYVMPTGTGPIEASEILRLTGVFLFLFFFFTPVPSLTPGHWALPTCTLHIVVSYQVGDFARIGVSDCQRAEGAVACRRCHVAWTCKK